MIESEHVERQKRFYETRAHDHLQVRKGDFYAQKLAGRLAETVGIRGEHRVLELGAGFGRFTFHLLEFCGSMVCLDMNQRVLDSLVRTRDELGIPPERCSVRCIDLADANPSALGEQFDFVVGFFLLHHLPDLPAAVGRIASLVRPGGRVAFVEPNRRNPLFAAQVAFCADMTWEEEKGLFRLSRSGVEAAFREADLDGIASERFGFFPPQLLNRFALARRLERHLEATRFLGWVLPFLLSSARSPQRDEAT